MEGTAVVLGGGLVGSLQALYLSKHGYRVQMLERRVDSRTTEITEGRSINLALSHRGRRAIREADPAVLEAVEAQGVPMYERQMHSVSGELTEQPYGKAGQHILSVPRRHLNETILTAAEKSSRVDVVFSTRVRSVDIDNSRVEYSVGDSDQVQCAAGDMLFGCDGAFSAVRKAFMRKEHFDYSQSYLSHGYKELCIPPVAEIPGGKCLEGAVDGYAMKPNCLHIWPRHQFMMIALPNKDRSFTVTLFLPFEGEGPNNFAALNSEGAVQDFFEREFPDVIPLLPNMHQEFVTNPTSSLVTVRCSPHTYGDRTCLLGDSAHAIVPFYGQGCNAGFEDVRVLFDMLKEQGGDWRATLRRYGKERPKDSHAIADLALYNFIEMRDHTASRMFIAKKRLERALMRVLPESVYLPMYSMVTFSHVPYSVAWTAGMRRDRYLTNTIWAAVVLMVLAVLVLMYRLYVTLL